MITEINDYVFCAATVFGPVAQAANGSHSNPFFDIPVGLFFLVLTWAEYTKNNQSKQVSIWIAVAISAICGIFIYSGVAELIRLR